MTKQSIRNLLRRVLLAAIAILSLLSAASFILPTLIRSNDIGVTLGFFFSQNKLLVVALSLVLLAAAFYMKWKDKGSLKSRFAKQIEDPRYRFAILGLADFKVEIVTLVIVVALTVMSSVFISRVIPFIALDSPTFTSADNAFISDDDFVVGISLDGTNRAYPLTMLAWHHIVNDEVSGKPIAITYCPICNSPIAFESEVEGSALQFDVETNYRANMVMVDRQTGSWWQQLTGEAIQGKLLGTVLEVIPVDMTTWSQWKKLYPDTMVLSKDTGFDYNYNVLPSGGSYADWQKSDRIPQPLVKITDTRFRAKETVLGVQIEDAFKAYPFSNLGEIAVINDEINGEPVLVIFESKSQIASAFSRKINGDILVFEKINVDGTTMIQDENTGSLWNFAGRAIEGEMKEAQLTKLNYQNAFWFAWVDFHPDTLVYGDN